MGFSKLREDLKREQEDTTKVAVAKVMADASLKRSKVSEAKEELGKTATPEAVQALYEDKLAEAIATEAKKTDPHVTEAYVKKHLLPKYKAAAEAIADGKTDKELKEAGWL